MARAWGMPQRETATHTQDLPHAYEGDNRLCSVCAGAREDLLHRAPSPHEQAAEHSPETLPRELGS